ncbi:permease [Amycolatopsis acidiphila]|nr:permease [Amycolatopsis acidiphila]GHG99114.1 hypothetical protein GCM10017788_79540 [Amycolatopsis acidiphila]
MIVLLALLFRVFVRKRLIEKAREQAERGLAGAMEGHAAMDMSVAGVGSFRRRLFSPRGFTSVSHVFVMEWAAILRDLVMGLLVAGAIGAWGPESFWRAFFFTGHPVVSALWGPLVGPVVRTTSRLWTWPTWCQAAPATPRSPTWPTASSRPRTWRSRR